MNKTIHVQTTVDLPGPSFRGIRLGDVVYVALDDVIAHLSATAEAFDAAHAEADIGRSIRAYRDAIQRAPAKEFS